jgi:hypothetical protein
MTYNQKANKLKELFYRTNLRPFDRSRATTPAAIAAAETIKWRNPKELSEYLEKFGGQIKTNKKRRKGYLIVHLQQNMYAEIPMDFAEKALVLGGFP